LLAKILQNRVKKFSHNFLNILSTFVFVRPARVSPLSGQSGKKRHCKQKEKNVAAQSLSPDSIEQGARTYFLFDLLSNMLLPP